MDFDFEDCVFELMEKAINIREGYKESADQASQLCKPVRAKKKAGWPSCMHTQFYIYTVFDLNKGQSFRNPIDL